jgi:hypothetical protein
MNNREPKIIDVHDGSTSESWLVVYADGRICYHVESNGPRILRHGVEAHEEWLSLSDVVKLDGQHYRRNLVEQVQAALAELTCSAASSDSKLPV